VRLVTKIAHSTAKGREKRYVVVSTSNEFPLRAVPSSPELTEVARTEIALDDSNPTFALPAKISIRKGMDKLVRFQVMWNTSTNVVSSDFCIGEGPFHASPLSFVWSDLHAVSNYIPLFLIP